MQTVLLSSCNSKIRLYLLLSVGETALMVAIFRCSYPCYSTPLQQTDKQKNLEKLPRAGDRSFVRPVSPITQHGEHLLAGDLCSTVPRQRLLRKKNCTRGQGESIFSYQVLNLLWRQTIPKVVVLTCLWRLPSTLLGRKLLSARSRNYRLVAEGVSTVE